MAPTRPPRKRNVEKTDDGKRLNVTREEFTSAMTAIQDNVRDLEIQFRRIAQIQADLDVIKHALLKRPRR